MKTFEVLVRKTVTDQEIDDIMVTAFEGGITYWCGEARVIAGQDGKPFIGLASSALTRNHAINLYDSEEERWRKLTLKKLLKAFSKLNFDFENYDAGDADNAVQTAVFGDIIYG